MKTYSIGRDPGSNIHIDDKLISRHHALLRVYPTGKMELVDMSSNGTFVNGVKLASNVPFPVTRKDMVSFAHARQLDWSYVPNPLAWVKWAAIAAGVIVVLIIAAVCISKCGSGSDDIEPVQQQNPTSVKDSKDSKDIKDGDAKSKDASATPGKAKSGDADTADEGSISAGSKAAKWPDRVPNTRKGDNTKKPAGGKTGSRKPNKPNEEAAGAEHIDML